MAPRRQRQKVGLTRMDAARDALRPMGFSSDVVRKSVKNLLKVYGDGGWAFIEEASYKLLIDTILEESEVPLIEPPAQQHLLLEGGSPGSCEQPNQPVKVLCDKIVVFEEQAQILAIQEAEIQEKDVKDRNQDVDAEFFPMPLQSISEKKTDGAHCPQSTSEIPVKRQRKPYYGWISDSEDDDNCGWISEDEKNNEFLQLTPAKEYLSN